MIAATALTRGKIVVTNNEKHYAAIQEHFALDVENWMTRKASFLREGGNGADEEEDHTAEDVNFDAE